MKEKLEALIEEMQAGGILYDEAVREFKKQYIIRVLKICKGNQCEAARLLHMHRNSLNRTLNEFKIKAADFHQDHWHRARGIDTFKMRVPTRSNRTIGTIYPGA